MTAGQTCANCKAFAPLEGQCRRHAPVAAPVHQGEKVITFGVYPGTRRDGWCTEWLTEESVH